MRHAEDVNEGENEGFLKRERNALRKIYEKYDFMLSYVALKFLWVNVEEFLKILIRRNFFP